MKIKTIFVALAVSGVSLFQAGCASPTVYSLQDTMSIVHESQRCEASDYVCGTWKVTAKGADWDIALVPVDDDEYAYHGVVLRLSGKMHMFDVGEVMVKLRDGDRIHEGVQLWKNLAGVSLGYRDATFTFTTESSFVQDNEMVLGFSVIGTEWSGERIDSY